MAETMERIQAQASAEVATEICLLCRNEQPTRSHLFDFLATECFCVELGAAETNKLLASIEAHKCIECDVYFDSAILEPFEPNAKLPCEHSFSSYRRVNLAESLKAQNFAWGYEGAAQPVSETAGEVLK